MLPWSNKAGSSSGPSSIQRDENLANSSQYRPSGSNTAESSRFRSTPASSSSLSQHDQAFDAFANSAPHHHPLGAPLPPFQSSHPLPLLQQQDQPHQSPMDGGDVQAFLNSADYADAVYGDDLHQDSTTYRSYQRQHDHDHSVAEHHQRQLREWTELLAAEDIVAYLQNVKYSDDIYGAPPAVEALIREAQQEATAGEQEQPPQNINSAVARLSMLRDHLMAHAHGQVEVAAKQAQQLQESDWENIFAKSTSL